MPANLAAWKRSIAAFAGAWITATAVPALANDAPAVTRPRYEGATEATSSAVAGTAFFLATANGPVAVGAAHSFDRAKIAAAAEMSFQLGRSNRTAGRASRVLVEPGLAFSAPGGSLSTDLVVFALDAPPQIARILEAGPLPKEGDRIRLLGIPSSLPHDEDDIFGTVESAAPDRLEVLLDVFYDLRGWGGAPLLSHPEGKVLGLIQAATPDGRRLRITATPIGVVNRAIAKAGGGGRGKALASLAPPGTTVAPAPAPAPERPKDAVVLEAPGAASKKVVSGNLAIEIEHPGDGAIFGDELGAFVAGRATDDVALPKIEVVFVIDTSGSASAPSGMDVNGNGVVGDDKLSVPGVMSLGSTDPGDTVLAAEVAAAKQFLSRLDPRYTRVSVVTYSGIDRGTSEFEVIDPDSVRTEVALTSQYRDVERALDRVLQRGAEGATFMSGGVDQATVELLGLRGSLSDPDRKAEKLVVFLTDGQPTMPRRNPEAAVLRAARRAKRAGIRFFTYGIGEEALSRPQTITALAEITRGAFTPVRDARSLGDLVERVELAGIAEVTLQNKTLKQPAHAVELAADGGFGAMVPLAPGKNVIEVTAKGTDGRVASKTITLQYAPDAKSPTVPPDLIARRNRLLEDRLVQLKRVRIATEDQKAEQVRRELEIEIEKAREERRRKELELKVQREGKEPPEPAPAPATP